MYVRDIIGQTLHQLGVRMAFGVIGSGNFHYTTTFVAAGGHFVPARHEGGAATMADAYSRMSNEVTVLSLHQGCGYTNALTGITEAVKSRTPLLVLTAEATEPTSNFSVDQAGIAESVGAVATRVRSAKTAVEDVVRAHEKCATQRCAVVLNVPIDVQDAVFTGTAAPPARQVPVGLPRPTNVDAFVDQLQSARRPVFVAGRGARTPGAPHAIAELARHTGALLATSAVSRGMFREDPWNIDVAGGFSTPLAAELISGADLIVGFGCALNMWTTRHGKLIADDATVVQVDVDRSAIGRNRDVDLGVWGGVTETACDALAALSRDDVPVRPGYRTPQVAERIKHKGSWTAVPFADQSGSGRVDPRAMTFELNRLLPSARIVSVDSGNFVGYPSMYLDVPDEYGFCFTQAFQSVGLGLATAIGAAIARPDRIPVAACGDGGFLMGISELETAVRLRLPLLVVVYNDAMYGAEVHHFGEAADLSAVTFPDVDVAAVARGHGCRALTVRRVEDLLPVKNWLDDDAAVPLVIDAKVTSHEASWWLAEAFGH